MAVVMHMRWAGVTKDQYEKVRSSVKWESDVPKGAKFHVASFDGQGLRVTDLWDTEADFNTFVEKRLMTGVQQAGIQGQPEVEFTQVHAVFSPNPSL